MRPCARPGCGHDENDHEFGDGECYAYIGTRLCTCSRFVEERPEPPPSLAVGVMGVIQNLGADVVEPCLDAVEGYRSKLVGMGYPADAAANMAADYHRLLLAAFTSASSDERRTTT